jgi:two-component system, cell cycle sensor histidine kinase and response regulator CckA
MADALRASHPGTKFLFTSGYTDDALMQHGVLRPDVKFLQKPYMTATLTRKVREVLDEDPTGIAANITTCS